MALFIPESELALIGYRWPDAPKIVFECSFVERVALWKEGYSVDAIPVNEAVKMKAELDKVRKQRKTPPWQQMKFHHSQPSDLAR